MGMFKFHVEIKAPLEKVFAFIADQTNFEKTAPEGTETRIEKISGGPVGSGTITRFSGVIGGRKVEAEGEIVKFEENHKFEFRQIKGGLKKWEGSYEFDATEKGTRVTVTVDYELPYSVLGKIMDWLKVGKEIEGYYRANIEKAKEILEEG